MILPWLMYALFITLLLAATAALAEAAGAVAPASRRWLWLAAMAASVSLPLLSLLIPASSLSEGIWSAGDIAAQSALARGFTASDLNAAVLGGWLVLSGILAATLIAQIIWAVQRSRTGRTIDIDGVPVLVSHDTGPAVIGIHRPTIIVPEWFFALDRESRRLTLLHEREHVRAGDLHLQLLAAVLVTAFPWNAGLWWQYRRLQLATELDCDRRVLRNGVSAPAYGRTLLLIAERCRGTPRFASALIGTAPMLRRRIADICAPAPGRRRLIGCIAAACGILAILAGCLPPARSSSPSTTEARHADPFSSTPLSGSPRARFTPNPDPPPSTTSASVTARQVPDIRQR